MKIKTFKWLILTIISMVAVLIGAYLFIFYLLTNPSIGAPGFFMMLIGGFCTGSTSSEFLNNLSSDFRKKSNAKAC